MPGFFPSYLPAGVDGSLALGGDGGSVVGIHRVAAGDVQAQREGLGDEASRPARDVQDLLATQFVQVQREHLERLGQRAAKECDAPELEPVVGRRGTARIADLLGGVLMSPRMPGKQGC